MWKSEIFRDAKLKERERRRNLGYKPSFDTCQLLNCGQINSPMWALVLHLPIQGKLETNELWGVFQQPSFQSLWQFWSAFIQTVQWESGPESLSSCESCFLSWGSTSGKAYKNGQYGNRSILAQDGLTRTFHTPLCDGWAPQPPPEGSGL